MSKAKILVVDDEPEIVELVKIRLEANEYEVIAASDGVEGLKRAKEDSPDLILLDVMMPGMDGFNVCRMLKFDEKYKDIPIIFLTAREQKEDRDTGEQVAVDGYITKPFEADVLLAKIEELLVK